MLRKFYLHKWKNFRVFTIIAKIGILNVHKQIRNILVYRKNVLSYEKSNIIIYSSHIIFIHIGPKKRRKFQIALNNSITVKIFQK